MSHAPWLALGALVALGLGAPPPAATAQGAVPRAALTEVTVERSPDGTKVGLKLTRAVAPKAAMLDEPARLVLDFPGVEYRWDGSPNKVGGDPVVEVRGSQYHPSAARVVIELTRRAYWKLEPAPDGLRIVFPRIPALAPADQPAPPPKAAPQPPAAPQRALELQGIVVRGDEAVAYIRDPVSKEVKTYRTGDRVGDAVIERIGERDVVLKTATGTLELRLEKRGPGK